LCHAAAPGGRSTSECCSLLWLLLLVESITANPCGPTDDRTPAIRLCSQHPDDFSLPMSSCAPSHAFPLCMCTSNTPNHQPFLLCRVLITKPANVARTLKVDSPRLLRLLYLRSTGRDAGISLGQALGLTPLDFRRMYPRYVPWLVDWRQQRERRGQAAAAVAAATGGGGGLVTARTGPAVRQTKQVVREQSTSGGNGAALGGRGAPHEGLQSSSGPRDTPRRLFRAVATAAQQRAQSEPEPDSTAGRPSVAPAVSSRRPSSLQQRPGTTGGGRRVAGALKTSPPVEPAAGAAAAPESARGRPKWPELDEDDEDAWRDAMSSI
jgi:hypothetical protein